MFRNAIIFLTCLLFNISLLGVAAGQANMRVLEFRFEPTARTQIAIWIEDTKGNFLQTVRLTDAVGRYGIGNRPGALQMNSGYRWPYGRREGVLPVWAHKRAAAADAQKFRRVIFQDRSEGHASRRVSDYSADSYFCLSFSQEDSKQDALDATSCASPQQFSSDKGRYLTKEDQIYQEPYQGLEGSTLIDLSLWSLYPPRRDVTPCDFTDPGCYDHPDVESFADDTKKIIPEIDAISEPTPQGNRLGRVLFTVPEDWPNGQYVAWIEVNLEGDHNAFYNEQSYPPPTDTEFWDSWAIQFGYSYRGQPSIVYRVPFSVGKTQSFTAQQAYGYSSVDGRQSNPLVQPIDETISDDPELFPESGTDRLRTNEDWKVKINVLSSEACELNKAPEAPSDLEIQNYGDKKRDHQWAKLSFVEPKDDLGVIEYEVKTSTKPIQSEQDFQAAPSALTASVQTEALVVESEGQGTKLSAELGGLLPQTHYYVAVRAKDICNVTGAFVSAEITTTPIDFETVSPCFIATVAYGSSMAAEVQTLREFRNRYLMPYRWGRWFVESYYRYGPHAAEFVENRPWLRGLTRFALFPIVKLAGWLT